MNAVDNDCPACGGGLNDLLDFRFADFDTSPLNVTARFRACPACGFVGVDAGLADDDLAAYYREHCLYSAQSGVGVGGDSEQDRVRYARYMDIARRTGVLGGGLVDVGCSRGGFLRYLRENAPESVAGLLGVDIDMTSLRHVQAAGIEAREGSALALPFPDQSQGLLCYFHVLEHVVTFNRVLEEVARVLRPDTGTVIFEVPDAARYGVCPVGPGFWLAMKEHVNHFSPASLIAALRRHEMEPVSIERGLLPMKGRSAYPSLIAVARRGPRAALAADPQSEDVGDIGAYVGDHSRACAAQVQALRAAVAGVEQVTFWGIGLEFFNLVAHGVLDVAPTVHLVDANPAKQGKTVGGISVSDPATVDIAGRLVCASYLSADSIAAAAQELGWPSHALYRLS